MKQTEMSKYLKMITVGIGVLLLVSVLWFLPLVLKDTLTEVSGNRGYFGVCILIGISAIPAMMCLVRFWGICESIRQDKSFSRGNAHRLKRMSQYMLVDTILYAGFLVFFIISGWYIKGPWLMFPVFLAIFIAMTLTILCAALSHLVQKASDIQEEQNLTI